jgi:hypothetical protein
VALGALLLGAIAWHSVHPLHAIAGTGWTAIDGLQAVTLVFGSKDSDPSFWDGSASLSTGTIEKIEGYHFTKKDSVTGNSWQCSTYPWAGFRHEMDPQERPQPRATPLETIGVTIYYRAPSDSELHVQFTPKLAAGTVPGNEFTLKLADIPEDGSTFPFSARVEARRSPVVQSITGSQYEDDFPSISVDGDSTWVAWVAFKDNADRVFLRRYREGHWDEPLTVTEKPGDLFMSGIAASRGRVTVVWSEHEQSDWHLKARSYDGANFGPVEPVTSGTGKSLFHQVASDGNGNVHVAYQSWRNRRSDIYLRSRLGGKWQPEILISDARRDAHANDWDASLAVGHDGTVWVAWDGYATGNYETYLRHVIGIQPGPMIRVTNSTRYHAHPSLAVDAQSRVWIAYDEAPENWGKDAGFLFSGGTGLYQARTVKVAVYTPAGGSLTPLRQPDDVTPYAFKRYLQEPKLVAASDGRMWLFMRPRTEARFPTSLWAAGGKWEVCGTYYSGDRWSDLKMFPNSVGRNGGAFAATADANGNAWVALNTDQKFWGGPEFGEMPGNNDIEVAKIEKGAAAPAPVLAERPPEPPGALPSEPDEKAQIATIRNYTVQANGKKFKIYRGDLHRHTEISLDGAGDGTLWDAYRYAMDAAGLDFVVVTDHQSGDQPYPWWRIQKSADMFDVPGFFAGVYGTERSVSYPNGHRNLMFTQRGVPILDISREENQGKVDSGPILYPFLKKYNGIASPHSPTTGMGTDWRDNDPAVDPIVELWEGSRASAEHEGAPLAPTAQKTELWAGGYKPLGFVWNAWAKGYKLGVQASSDHASTHLSYTAVIAENGSREAIVDAMRRRHTYAATRNILLDYRMNADGKTYIQGDELTSGSMPELRAHVVAAGPLKNVVVVRDNQYIYSTEPQGDTFDLTYTERSLTPGEHYYYIRVEQKDRNMAWSSPIWIRYK